MMMNILIRLVDGQMRIITISKIFFFFAICLFSSKIEAKVLPYLSIYDKAEYPMGFEHFSYVNPAAPKGGRLVMPTYGTFDNFNLLNLSTISCTNLF